MKKWRFVFSSGQTAYSLSIYA